MGKSRPSEDTRRRTNALHVAAEKGYEDLAKLLVASKADVTAMIKKGATAADLAEIQLRTGGHYAGRRPHSNPDHPPGRHDRDVQPG